MFPCLEACRTGQDVSSPAASQDATPDGLEARGAALHPLLRLHTGPFPCAATRRRQRKRTKGIDVLSIFYDVQ